MPELYGRLRRNADDKFIRVVGETKVEVEVDAVCEIGLARVGVPAKLRVIIRGP